MTDRGRQYLSGAKKRKQKTEKLEAAGKLPKIDGFFKVLGEAKTNQENVDKKYDFRDDDISQKVFTEDSQGGYNQEQASTSKFNTEIANVEGLKQNYEVTELNLNAQENTIAKYNELDESAPFNTDRALFPDVLTDEMKRKIILSGPNRPMGSFVRNIHTNRSFSAEYYYTCTKTGQKIDRFWLCYSPILNAVYCQPCWLFSDREQSHAWCDGTISDWKGLSKKIKIHEESAAHFRACITYTSWEKNKTVDKLIRGSQETIKEVLIRIFDTTRTLAICSLPFRGHHENVFEIGPQSGIIF